MSSINKLNLLVVPALMAILLLIGATSIAFAKSPEAVPSCEIEQSRLSGRSTGLPVLPRLVGPDAGVIVDFAELTVDEIAALFGVTEYKSTNAQGQIFYTQVGSEVFTSSPVTTTVGRSVGRIRVGFRFVDLGNGRVTTQFGYLSKPEEEVGADADHLAQCAGTRAAPGIRGFQGADRLSERQQRQDERGEARLERTSKNELASAPRDRAESGGKGRTQKDRPDKGKPERRGGGQGGDGDNQGRGH